MKCSVRRNITGAIVEVKTQDGAVSKLFKDLVRYYNGNKEKALNKYAKQYDIEFDQKYLDSLGEPKMEFLLNPPKSKYSLLFDPTLSPEDEPVGISQYIVFKNQEISNLHKRLKKIKTDLLTADFDRKKELVKQRQEIINRIYGDKTIESDLGLKGEVDEIKELKNIIGIRSAVIRDMARLDHLSRSTDPAEMEEADRIAEFYKQIGDFSDPTDHPIFEREEIVGENGEMLIPNDVVEEFSEYSKMADEHIRNLNNTRALILTTATNNSPLKMDMFENDFTYDEIVPTEGLPDATWVDANFYDMSKGIFTHNGVIPQLTQEHIQNTLQTHISKNQFYNGMNLAQLQQRINDIGKAVHEKSKAQGSDDVSDFDIFLQKNKNGLRTGELIHRHTTEFREHITTTLNAYRLTADDIKRGNTYLTEHQNLLQNRNDNIRDVGSVLDITRIPELADAYEFITPVEDDMYADEIRNRLGEQNYRALVDEQKQKIDAYIEERALLMSNARDRQAVEELDNIHIEDRIRLEIFDAQSSPLSGYQSFIDDQLSFVNTGISRQLVTNSLGNNVIIPASQDSLNPDFAAIDSDPLLSEMYNLVSSVLNLIYTSVPDYYRRQITPHTIPQLLAKKDVLKNSIPNVGNLMSNIWNGVVSGSTIANETDILYASRNITTGQVSVEAKLNLATNNRRVENQFFVLAKQFDSLSTENIRIPTDRNTITDLASMSVQQIELIARLYDVPPTLNAIRQLGEGTNMVDIGGLLYDQAVHQTTAFQNLDIPKITKYFAANIVDYNARQDVLPLMHIFRDAYHAIKAPATTRSGNHFNQLINGVRSYINLDKGERTNANKQMDDQLQRVLKINLTGDEEKHLGILNKRLRNTEETKQYKALKKLLADDNLDETEKAQIQEQMDNLGSQISLQNVFLSYLNFNRILSIGWNLGSGVTNLTEGSISNHLAASTGRYFEPNSIFEAQSVVFNATFGRLFGNKNYHKLQHVMTRFGLLQDSSNELQKADYEKKGLLGKGRLLRPYLLNKSIEYINQGQMIVARMMSTEITGLDGSISNVWAEMDADGKLSPNFRTEGNIETWEQVRSPEFKKWKNESHTMIETYHGNYSMLKGMMIKDHPMGKALMMFKTFLPNQFYIRFHTEQDNLESGIKGSKGYYRSATKTQAAVYGALSGTIVAGPLGTAVGAGAGYLYSRAFNTVEGHATVGQELTAMGIAMWRKLVGLPLNTFLAAFKAKGAMMNSDTVGTFRQAGFNKVDAENMSRLITDMALLTHMTMAMMITKAFFDDDEEKDPKYMWAINTLGGFQKQLMQYHNVKESWESITSAAFITIMKNIAKFFEDLPNMFSDRDIITNGPYQGQSKSARSFQKLFLPKIGIPGIGSDGALGYVGSDRAQQIFNHNRTYLYDAFDTTKRKEKDKRAKNFKLRQELNKKYEYKIKEYMDAGYSKEQAEKKLKNFITSLIRKKNKAAR